MQARLEVGRVTLLLVTLAVAVAWRFRYRLTRRARALVSVTVILALNVVVSAPAQAQTDCGQAPAPERPGSGMVGALDPPQGNGEDNTPYLTYGYAGMVWHVYDDQCGLLTFSSPKSTLDTWVGNQLFDIAKNLVGVTNSLHYTLLNGGVLSGLNDKISRASQSVFDTIYGQLFGLALLILVVLLFRHLLRGDLNTVTRRGLFAFAGMWLAASGSMLAANYGRIDELIVSTTTGIQAGFVDPNDTRVIRDVLPTELHTRVVYDNWLRGEFGSPTAPQASQYGDQLLNAQAWTVDDLRQGRDADDGVEQTKKDHYRQLAADPRLGAAKGYLTGADGSRAGAGFLALLQALAYTLFQLLAKFTVFLAQLLLRVFTLTAPILGLVAIISHDILRKVGTALGAIALHVLVMAALAGVHFRLLQLVLTPDRKLPLLTQLLLAGITTVVLLRTTHPLDRVMQMLKLSINAFAHAANHSGASVIFAYRKRIQSTARVSADAYSPELTRAEILEATHLQTPPPARIPRRHLVIASELERLTAGNGTGALPEGRTPFGYLSRPEQGTTPQNVPTWNKKDAEDRAKIQEQVTAIADRLRDTFNQIHQDAWDHVEKRWQERKKRYGTLFDRLPRLEAMIKGTLAHTRIKRRLLEVKDELLDPNCGYVLWIDPSFDESGRRLSYYKRNSRRPDIVLAREYKIRDRETSLEVVYVWDNKTGRSKVGNNDWSRSIYERLDPVCFIETINPNLKTQPVKPR